MSRQLQTVTVEYWGGPLDGHKAEGAPGEFPSAVLPPFAEVAPAGPIPLPVPRLHVYQLTQLRVDCATGARTFLAYFYRGWRQFQSFG